MTRTETDAGAITLVNIFGIEPEQLDSFLGAWHERAEFMSQQPGFRSLRVLRAVSAGARFGLVRPATGHARPLLLGRILGIVATLMCLSEASIQRSAHGVELAALQSGRGRSGLATIRVTTNPERASSLTGDAVE
jgi:hypothetical protein